MFFAPFLQSLLIIDIPEPPATQIPAGLEILSRLLLGVHGTKQRTKASFSSFETVADFHMNVLLHI
jgi:hypothetical protein